MQNHVSKSTHRQSFIDILTEDIRTRAADESLTFSTASTRVLIEWLGYEVDDVIFIDGRDRGVDAWLSTETGLDIFQIKTHDLTEAGFLDLRAFDSQGVQDLSRAKDLLLSEKEVNVQTKGLKELLSQWSATIRNHRLEESRVAISVTLHLIILGEILTNQAKLEYQAFQVSLAKIEQIDGVDVQFHAVLHTVDDIIDLRWREENREWKDRNGKRFDTIHLQPSSSASIIDAQNAVFYCRAIDLVRAYDALGYQLFEPNVRANIKNSRVNRAIRDSVLHQRTRREFRFLNNGVTITCDNFGKPSQHRNSFLVTHPGIVNGLQTVIALHTAYYQLSDQEKADFEAHCLVLVRLLMNNAVEDITRVVRATNNQNPMKPRNLVSNNTEQLLFARIFADQLGWFYEAKEGAWDAFEHDPKRWRPDLQKRQKDFQVGGRGKVRRVDNQDLAQSWLAFIGFAYEAINNKKELFDDHYYPLIFLSQTRKHGYDYPSITSAKDDSVNQSPTAHLMLVSYLTRRFAEDVTIGATQNRQEAYARLNLDPQRLSRAELDTRLGQDDIFLLNQALNSMSGLFTEFVGFMFFRALGEDIHRLGHRILDNHSYCTLKTQFSLEALKELIDKQTYSDHDLLIVLWLAFKYFIEDMLSGDWRQSYQLANVKTRFVFSKPTRERLFKMVMDTNEYMKKRNLTKPWAVGVAEGQNLFDFVRSCVL